MKRYSAVFILSVTFSYIYGQNIAVIGQPVVCAAQSSTGNIIVPIMPSSIIETDAYRFQMGSYFITPSMFSTGIKNVLPEPKQSPYYDRESNSFIISGLSAKSEIFLYSLEGILLCHKQFDEESVILNANDLPRVTIVRAVVNDGTYCFKLFKQE